MHTCAHMHACTLDAASRSSSRRCLTFEFEALPHVRVRCLTVLNATVSRSSTPRSHGAQHGGLTVLNATVSRCSTPRSHGEQRHGLTVLNTAVSRCPTPRSSVWWAKRGSGASTSVRTRRTRRSRSTAILLSCAAGFETAAQLASKQSAQRHGGGDACATRAVKDGSRIIICMAWCVWSR